VSQACDRGPLLTYLFLGGFLDPSILTIIMVLCTLHGPERRRGRADRLSQYLDRGLTVSYR
jgi:hypothetical protein